MTNELITSGFGREKGETVLNFYLVPFFLNLSDITSLTCIGSLFSECM